MKALPLKEARQVFARVTWRWELTLVTEADPMCTCFSEAVACELVLFPRPLGRMTDCHQRVLGLFGVIVLNTTKATMAARLPEALFFFFSE